MQRSGLFVLQDPAWKGGGAGFQLGGFPVVHYCRLALACGLLVPGLAQTERYPGLDRYEELPYAT